MEILQTRALRGPNLWSRYTALEIEVRCAAAELGLEKIPGFEETLRSLFPGVGELRALGYTGPLTLAHVLEATLLALQAQAGCPVSFSQTSLTPVAGVFQVVVEYSEEDVGRLALKMSQEIVAHALKLSTGEIAPNASTLDVTAMQAELRELDEDNRLGPSTGSIVTAGHSCR
jgi:cyanophycin synthetase